MYVEYFNTSPYTLADLKQLSDDVNELIYKEKWDILYNLFQTPKVQCSCFMYDTKIRLYDDLMKTVDANINAPKLSRVLAKISLIGGIISLFCGLFIISFILFICMKYFSFGGNNIKARRREAGCKALKLRLLLPNNFDSRNTE